MESPISLIANSGIQFHTVRIDLGPKSPAMSTNIFCCETTETDDYGNKHVNFIPPSDIYYYNEQYVRPSLLNPEAKDAQGRILEDKIRPDFALNAKLREDTILTVSAREAIDVFENIWLPCPYFRLAYYGDGIHQGPQTWARMFLSRSKTTGSTDSGPTHTHELTFAFDTNCSHAEIVNLTEELVPSTEAADAGARFRCVTRDSENLFWLAKDWLGDWLETETKRKRKILERRFADFDQLQWLHIGIYLALLEALQKAGAFPEFTLHTDKSPREVDLVLDVGNSRTCGLVIESSGGGNATLSITDARPLRIRYLTKPGIASGDPFEMKLAFVKETFGEEAAAALSGNPYAFQYPSLVRVGREAVELSTLYDTGNHNSIFSSPKRYLWDMRRATQAWTHIPLHNEPFTRPALYGISDKFTDDGRLLSRAETEALERGLMPPHVGLDPQFSRSSLMTFALIEIILQALGFVNSYEYRCDRQHPNVARKLRRIVLTCPTAMLKTEKIILREAAQDAVAALRSHFDALLEVDMRIIPDPKEVARQDIDAAELAQLETLPENIKRKEWGFDEATCSQLTFIFSEITHRFKSGNTQLYFETVGKPRQGTRYPDQPAVTLASVDIGGGTTDLMIACYQTDPESQTPVLTPNPLFWEGFNLAGDNLLKRMIEQLVMPSIQQAAERLGCQQAIGVMNDLFGPYHGGQSHKDRMMKRYFVQQIAIPVAYGIMQHAQESRDIEIRSFDSFYVHHNAPNQNLLEHINQAFIQTGATGFDLRNIEWTLDIRLTNEVVRNVFEPMLRDLCSIIVQHQCDYVLLSGRPTTLPVVREIVLKYLPATPDRIVSLGNYRVGEWYPFAKNGFVRDPKTCVAVGAAIALMSGTLNRMGNFTLKTDWLANKVVSTADYIGQFNENAAKVTEIYFDPVQSDYTLKFNNTIFLGMRQMDDANWIGSPMYRLSFANDQAAEQLRNQLPLTVDLHIANRRKDKEKLTIRAIRDQQGRNVEASKLNLQLQTLTDEHGYWLDTGIFSLNIVG